MRIQVSKTVEDARGDSEWFLVVPVFNDDGGKRISCGDELSWGQRRCRAPSIRAIREIMSRAAAEMIDEEA